MLNTVILMGRLTRDPELRYTQSQIPVASFTLAVDRDFTSKDKNKAREADFINCVAWRSTAEFVDKYFTKGSAAAVKGRLQSREYLDKSNNKRTAFEVVVDDIYFAGEKKAASDRYAPVDIPHSDFYEIADDDGELPF